MDDGGERQTLVVIGNGMTSHALCKRLSECGITRGELRVVVFGEEPRPAYDRVHLTDLLSGKSEDDLTFAPPSWYEEQGIELALGDPVVAIDRDECLVRSARGATMLFDRLVFATGSRPFVPPIPGADLPGVFVYRTVEDLHAILAHAAVATRAAVIGGGLLGLEAARAVHALGLDVTVLEASPGLMARQLDPTGARLLGEHIEALGLRVRTGARSARIEEGARRDGPAPERVIVLADGSRIEADLVILAAGIRPRAEIAAEAGLELAPSGGILVDDHLATSDGRIFAVGECATHRGTTYGLAAPGYRMVDVLVNNLGGGDAVFEGASLSAKLKLLGVQVASLGRHDERATPGATAHSYLAGGVYRKLVVASGQIIGALAIGAWDDLVRIEDALAEPRRFSFWDLRRFRGTGTLWQRSESPPVHEWPAEALVCGCLGVRRGALTEAEAAGCCTVEMLSARTGAGTMCGSCKPLLADYLHRERADSLPPSQLAVLRTRSVPPPPPSAPASERPEDTPPTLRCKPEDEEPAPPNDGPLSVRAPRLPGGLPRRRPAFDTMVSVPPVLDGVAAQARESISIRVESISAPFGAALPAAAARLSLETAEPAPASVAPASSLRLRVPVLDPVSPTIAPPPSTRGSGPEPVARGSAPPSVSRGSAPPSVSRGSAPPSVSRGSAPPSVSRGSVPPPSSRRDSMRPLRPVSVAPGRLPSIPPARLSIAPPAPAQRAEERRRRVLVASSALGSLGALITLVAPALSPATSLRGLHLDAAIVAPVVRQASGWAIVVLSTAGLLLSLRKRIKRFAFGDVPGLRALHGALGAATLACLFLHTGLHLGVRLNRLLMIDFLALSAFGGVAGVFAAGSDGADPATAQARRLLAFRAHVLLFLPLPILVALHVLGAYYF